MALLRDDPGIEFCKPVLNVVSDCGGMSKAFLTECVGHGASFHAEQHGQPRVEVQ